MALYPPAIKKLLPLDKSRDPKIAARVVILHVAATNASSLFDYFNGPSGGVESHFYILKDGTVEQYRDTAYQADANMRANDFAISIETQGLAAGTWTDAQIATIEDLLTWCHTTHGIPLVKCPTWDGSGVGYHILFEDQWDMRNASCPGPQRIQQFENVLVPWMSGDGGSLMALTDQQQQDMYNRVMGGIPAGDARGRKNPDGTPARVLDTLDGNYLVGKIDAIPTTAEIAAAVPAGGSIDYAALAAAVVDELASRGITMTILGKA